MTLETVANRPTLDQMLDSFIGKPTEVFNEAGIKTEFPFDIPTLSALATKEETARHEVLEQAKAVLTQVHIVRDFVSKNETADAVYHAFIVARHLEEFEAALADFHVEQHIAEATQDSQSSGTSPS